MLTMKDLAKEALEVQTCNDLNVVVHAFSRAMTELRSMARRNNWQYFMSDKESFNQHPIAVLYSERISIITSSPNNYSGSKCSFETAYDWCKFFFQEEN